MKEWICHISGKSLGTCDGIGVFRFYPETFYAIVVFALFKKEQKFIPVRFELYLFQNVLFFLRICIHFFCIFYSCVQSRTIRFETHILIIYCQLKDSNIYNIRKLKIILTYLFQRLKNFSNSL